MSETSESYETYRKAVFQRILGECRPAYPMPNNLNLIEVTLRIPYDDDQGDLRAALARDDRETMLELLLTEDPEYPMIWAEVVGWTYPPRPRVVEINR